MSDVGGKPRLGRTGKAVRTALRNLTVSKKEPAPPRPKAPRPGSTPRQAAGQTATGGTGGGTGAGGGGGGGGGSARDVIWMNYQAEGGVAGAFVESECAACIASMVGCIQELDVSDDLPLGIAEDASFQRLLVPVRVRAKRAEPSRYDATAQRALQTAANTWVTELLGRGDPLGIKVGEVRAAVRRDADRAASSFVRIYLKTYGERLIRTIPVEEAQAAALEPIVLNYFVQVDAFMDAHDTLASWLPDRLAETLRAYTAHLLA